MFVLHAAVALACDTPPGEPDPWTTFLTWADRVVSGTVTDVRVVEHRRGPLTEIDVDVTSVLLGEPVSSITVTQAYDGTRASSEALNIAPLQGDSILLTAGTWRLEPSRLLLVKYVRSVVTSSGGVKFMDGLGNYIEDVSCITGFHYVDDAALLPPPTQARSVWDGPDPVLLAAREDAAMDGAAALSATEACISAHLASK